MKDFPVITSEAVPPGKIFAFPSWITECRIIAGVPVRYRGSVIRNGVTYKQYSPLTDYEINQIKVLNVDV